MRLFTRTEVWAPTAIGWIVLGALLLTGLFLAARFAYPFLDVNRPLGQGYLAVEGWLSRPHLIRLSRIFRAGGYRGILVMGGPLVTGSYLQEQYPDLASSAEVGAAQLIGLGFSPEVVIAVPRSWARKDRTYESALALRRYLVNRDEAGESVDVFALGPHARRSWLLSSIALRDVARVGVISTKTGVGYDTERWWSSSAGFRDVMSELLALSYAKLLFYPDPRRDMESSPRASAR